MGKILRVTPRHHGDFLPAFPPPHSNLMLRRLGARVRLTSAAPNEGALAG